jgi:hypothetical protein
VPVSEPTGTAVVLHILEVTQVTCVALQPDATQLCCQPDHQVCSRSVYYRNYQGCSRFGVWLTNIVF